MSLTLQIQATGMDPIVQRVETLGQSFRDLRTLWPSVVDEFFAIESEMFDSEGATNESGTWAPLSATYAAWKARNWGTPILERKGDLRASLTSFAASVNMLPDELSIASTVPYAAYHQFGTGRMPARPVIDLSSGSIDRLMAVVQDWVAAHIQEVAA